MLVKVMCVGITPELWGKDKPLKDQRTVQRLNLIDCDDFCQVKETFDYVPTKEEEERIELTKLKMVVFSLGVSTWTKEDGRLKATRGKMDLGTVPPSLVKAPGSTSEPANAPAHRDNGKTVLSGMSAGSKTAPVSA